MSHSPNIPEQRNVIAALRQASVEDVLLPVLIQLVVILLAARLFATLFRRFGQPAVVGEIVAGLVLGPSLLGWLFPEAFRALFQPEIHGLVPELSEQLLRWVFAMLSQIGLILLLFLIGMEFDFGHLRHQGNTALSISLTGVVVPFLLGAGVAQLLLAHPDLGTHPGREGPIPGVAFALFLGTALSITAIPILGRLMMEWNITRTKLGTLTITAAAADDAIGWILLASVAAIAQTQFQPLALVVCIGATGAFAGGMIWLVRPLLCRWVRDGLRQGDGRLSLNRLAVILAILLTCAIATNLIGIFAIFGAFVLGAILSGEQEFREVITRSLGDLVTVFFLPIFFTYTGLRTRIDTLGSSELWLLCGAVLAAAVLGKFGGCGVAAWLGGLRWREAGCVGVMMNTRALMELIVINVGYEMRVIPPSVYCMLVLMALTTTVMVSPILMGLMRGTELEPFLRRSGFLRRPESAEPGVEPSAAPCPGRPVLEGTAAS